MARVVLENVRKAYPNGFVAVQAFSLDIADGEFVVFVGPSGCGKSTTLRMIAGLESISAGTVRIGDRVVNDVPPKDRDIAMVFQNYALYPHMTVRRNMAFALKLRGTPRAEIERRVAGTARMLGIEHLLDRRPGELSGGQRQRVAVGRAIVREPRAFLFDEPLSNLDAKLRVATRADLKALHQRLRTTTVYVTHDQEEAMTLGDRIVVMSNGLVQQVAPPLEVFRRPANRFVAGFVGTPPMNFLDGSLVATGDALEFVERPAGGATDAGARGNDWGDVRLRLTGAMATSLGRVAAADRPAAGAPIVLGIRPSCFSVDPAAGPPTHAAPAAPTMAITVSVVEPLGDAADVTGFTAGGQRIVARLPSTAMSGPAASNPPAPGSRLTLGVDLSRCHLFQPGDFGANLTLDQP